jgi:hypothetical protein
MPRISYKKKRFRDTSLHIISRAIDILEDYAEQGYDLTLRQLYYQFVARDLLVNSDKSYNNLGSIINNARMAGYIDWDFIVDRTRNVKKTTTWDSPQQIARAAADGYFRNRWDDQPYHVEVWIEKDALIGVIEGVCRELLVPYFSCRGYTSQSEMWNASQRLYEAASKGKKCTILHLGDHDPSGVDMSRDIEDRLSWFMANDYFRNETSGDDTTVRSNEAWEWLRDNFEVDRIALSMEQVRHFNPPPNPAKLTDSRAGDYIARYGRSSWELDALTPNTLTGLIRDGVEERIDHDRWEAQIEQETEERNLLTAAADEWEES